MHAHTQGPYKQVEEGTSADAEDTYTAEDDYSSDARTAVLAQEPQRTTMLAVSGWNTPFVNPYVPPKDLYIFWGKSSAKGTLASQWIGGSGRASSAQRIRQILNFGTFSGNHYVDDMTGQFDSGPDHAKYKQALTWLYVQGMATS